MWRLLCQTCPSLLPRGAQHSTDPTPWDSKPKSHDFFPPSSLFRLFFRPSCPDLNMPQPLPCLATSSAEITSPPGAEERVNLPRASSASLLWEMRHSKETAF